MGQVYQFSGHERGLSSSTTCRRRRPRHEAYGCDITYGTNNEFGFDYLRDNMKFEFAQMVQRGHQLRDRRRSGFDPRRRGAHAAHHLRRRPTTGRTSTTRIDKLIPRHLGRADFDLDEKQRSGFSLTDAGNEHMEGSMLIEAGAADRGRALRGAQRHPRPSSSIRRCARTSCSTKDKDYIVRDRAKSSSSTSSPAA